MRTVRHTSPAYSGVRFFSSVVNRVRYTPWPGGIIPNGPPSYATNAEVHRQRLRRLLLHRGMMCTAVPVIIQRIARVPIATRGNPAYDGGVQAYFGGVYGEGYYDGTEERFDLNRALSWARLDRDPVLLGKPYNGPALQEQGHAAVLLPSGYVLEARFGYGLVWMFHLNQQAAYWHAGGVMIRGHIWLDE